jgi:signal transduction histidine kinase
MVLIALATPPYIYFYSLQESLVTYPILLVLIFLFSHLITKTQNSGSKIALKMSSALIIVTGLLPYLLHLLVWQIINDKQAYVPTLITALALPLTYYVFMEVLQVFRPQALTLIRNDELRASDSLKESVTNIVSYEFSDNLHHQWAVYIHGKILTRLSATSLKLEAAADAGDSELYKNTIESLFALLSNPDADFNDVSTDLQTEVDNRLAPWVGLLEIDIHIDAQLKAVRTPRVRDLGEVIEELISNSIRHGKAKKIELRIVRSGEKDVEIISIDDASIAPSRPQDNPGLGSRIFNLASDGRWSIARVGSATEFRLTMAIEA